MLCRTRPGFLTGLVPIALLALAACAAEETTSLRPDPNPIPAEAARVDLQGQPGGQLRYALAGEPRTFNFAMAQDTRSRLLAYLTTATLLEFDPVEQSIKDGLSRSRQVSEDGKVIRVALRQGLHFSDGQPLTAEDVVFTFRKILEEESANPLKGSLMIGGKPLQVRKKTDFELEVEFPEPVATAEYLLTAVPVFPKHLMQPLSQPLEAIWTIDTPSDQMAGLGPFVIESHEPGRRTTLRYNPHFWKVDQDGRRLPYLDGLRIDYIEDRNNQLLRLQAHELDLMDQLLRPEDLQLLASGSSSEIRTQDAGPSGNLAFYWFNLSNGKSSETGFPHVDPVKQRWFQNQLFRQAVSAAISRKTIVENVYLGYATVATSLVPSSNRRWHLEQLDSWSDDPGLARSLLTEAGFSWRSVDGRSGVLVDAGQHPVSFELLVRSDDVLAKIAAIIQQDLEQVGMQVSVRQEDFSAVVSKITGSRAYESVLMNLDFSPDPNDYLPVFSSSGPMHMWNPRQRTPASAWEERVDALMRQQRTSLDAQNRFQLFEQVQQIIARQVPVVPLVNRNILLAYPSRVKLTPANLFPYAMANPWAIYLTE